MELTDARLSARKKSFFSKLIVEPVSPAIAIELSSAMIESAGLSKALSAGAADTYNEDVETPIKSESNTPAQKNRGDARIFLIPFINPPQKVSLLNFILSPGEILLF